MTVCTLTDIVSWFACAKLQVPIVGELIVMVVFIIFLQLLRGFPSISANANIGALVVSTLVAIALLGMGAINSLTVIVLVILLGLAAMVNIAGE